MKLEEFERRLEPWQNVVPYEILGSTTIWINMVYLAGVFTHTHIYIFIYTLKTYILYVYIYISVSLSLSPSFFLFLFFAYMDNMDRYLILIPKQRGMMTIPGVWNLQADSLRSWNQIHWGMYTGSIFCGYFMVLLICSPLGKLLRRLYQ